MNTVERPEMMQAEQLEAEWTQRMRDGLSECERKGWKRVAVYGAGRHTRAVAAAFDGAGVNVVAIVDDNPHRQHETIGGRRIVSPGEGLRSRLDAVVLSSSHYEDQLWESAGVFRRAGVPVVRLYGESGGTARPTGAGVDFRLPHYQRLNQRRLEHLSSLGLPIAGKRVLDLGCGVGDLTGFFVDRGCRVHCVDGREENLTILREQWKGCSRVSCEVRDLNAPGSFTGERFDIVFCYGLLYHLEQPARMLDFAAAACAGMLLLETCVSFGDGACVNPTAEDAAMGSQALGGLGCRPTRTWVTGQLRERFKHVYWPRTQPASEEFPTDWLAQWPAGRLSRSVWVGSRAEITGGRLTSEMPVRQPLE